MARKRTFSTFIFAIAIILPTALSPYFLGTGVKAQPQSENLQSFSNWDKVDQAVRDQKDHMGNDKATTTSNIQSDDFSSSVLNTSLWTVFNPVGDATLSLNGTDLVINVPAGVNHDIWGTTPEDFANKAPRIMQPANNTDFEIEVKFDSGVSKKFQTQGILIQADEKNLLRFEFFGDGTNTRIFAAEFSNGVPTEQGGSSYGTVFTGGDVAPLYMRVKRVSDQWTQSYSFDGTTWTPYVTFTRAMTVTAVGTYAGNAADKNNPGTEPAHTGRIDYFFNTASPIVPEDGSTRRILLPLVLKSP